MVKTEIKWKYLPSDFLEGPIVIALENGELLVDLGDATLTLTTPTIPITSAFLQILTDEVSVMFEVRQLLTHQTFELKGPQVIYHQSDGSIGTAGFFSALTVNLELKVNASDWKVIGADGTVKSDTKAERITSETLFVASIAPKLALSSVLRAMVRSYHQAVLDPENELVHLYEIRDAICTYFRNENEARIALTIPRHEFSSLRRLANDEPLREGRHRGKKIEEIRPATQGELAEARRISVLIIKAFADLI